MEMRRMRTGQQRGRGATLVEDLWVETTLIQITKEATALQSEAPHTPNDHSAFVLLGPT